MQLIKQLLEEQEDAREAAIEKWLYRSSYGSQHQYTINPDGSIIFSGFTILHIDDSVPFTTATINGDAKITVYGGASKVHKKIRAVNGNLELCMELGKPIMSAAMIKGVKSYQFYFWENVGPDESEEADGPVELSRLFNQLITGETDIHDIQEYLIDAGYPGMARL